MKCPYHIRERDDDYGRVIYGYTDDGDLELNKRDFKDLYLAGCVPDSYGVLIGSKWHFPTKRCNICKKFFDYKTEEDGAFLESP